MAVVAAAQVSVGTSATSILAVGAAGTHALIQNAGSNPVFLGPSGVTTGNGFSLAAGVTVELAMKPHSQLFGIVAAATEAVHVLSA